MSATVALPSTFLEFGEILIAATSHAVLDIADEWVLQLELWAHENSKVPQDLIIGYGGMLYGRLVEVRAEGRFTDEHRKTCATICEKIQNCRANGGPVLDDLLVCFFLLCDDDQRELIARRNDLNSLCHDALNPVWSEEMTETSTAIRIVQGDLAPENLVVAAEASKRRWEICGGKPSFLDIAMNYVLDIREPSAQQRLAFIVLFEAWLPAKVKKVDLSMILRIMLTPWVPNAVKIALAFYSAAGAVGFTSLYRAFGMELGCDFSAEIRKPLPECVNSTIRALCTY